jgi:hypothetical protein
MHGDACLDIAVASAILKKYDKYQARGFSMPRACRNGNNGVKLGRALIKSVTPDFPFLTLSWGRVVARATTWPH